MTSPADVELAVDAGADAIGVIVAESARRVSLERAAEIAAAVPPFVARYAVVVDPSLAEAEQLQALGFTLQFSGEEPPDLCERLTSGRPYLKVLHIDPGASSVDPAALEAYAHATWMFDTRVVGQRGGTGTAFSWDAVASIARERRIVISGGLDPSNVAACIRAARPYAIDVRSGVESNGCKDPERMRRFVSAVSEADAAD